MAVAVGVALQGRQGSGFALAARHLVVGAGDNEAGAGRCHVGVLRLRYKRMTVPNDMLRDMRWGIMPDAERIGRRRLRRSLGASGLGREARDGNQDDA